MSHHVGLRQRSVAVHQYYANGPEAVESNVGGSTENSKQSQDVTAETKQYSFISTINVAIHTGAILCFILGFVFRVQVDLHSGTECDMTYSMRVFLLIDTPTASQKIKSESRAAKSYKLYKFVDQRDPRYQHLLKSNHNQPLPQSEHCIPLLTPLNPSDTHLDGLSRLHIIALYIPGHWGSYSQARSLGAHGIQLTKARDETLYTVRQKLYSGQWHGAATNLDEFVYDVYTIDFGEQGGALHGEFLKLQSKYVAYIIQQLANDCQQNSVAASLQITLVGHSMGGYVARWTLLQYPDLLSHVNNVITLATPHANPLYAFEPTIHYFHRDMILKKESKALNPNSKNPLIISISGGLRDEMIDPFASDSGTRTSQQDASAFLSVQAIDLMKGAKASPSLEHPFPLGMDHRAIVWCHQLLAEVRRIIWVLAMNNVLPNSERQEILLKELRLQHADEQSYSYRNGTRNLYNTLEQGYGRFMAWCMESSMLYNLPLLFSMFSFLCTMRGAITGIKEYTMHPERYYSWLVQISAALPVFSTVSIVWIVTNVDLAPIVVMALVGNAINATLVQLLSNCMRGKASQNPFPLRRLIKAGATILLAMILVSLGLALVLFREESILVVWEVAGCIFFCCTIVAVYVTLWTRVYLLNPLQNNLLQLHLMSLTVLMIPVAMAGPVILMVWERSTRRDSWVTLLSTALPIWVGAATERKQSSKSLLSKNATEKELVSTMKAGGFILLFLTILISSPWTLARGSGFLVPFTAQAIAWIDVASSLLE